MEEIVVSNSPFIHSENDVNRLFLYISIALVFPTMYGVMNIGYGVLYLTLVSLFSCLFFEFMYNLFDKKRLFVDNLSFVVTGFLIALTLPLGTPLYVVIICSFIAIFVVKLAFGGLGRNYFNPALVARCFAGILIPDITSSLYKTTIAGEEYISVSLGGTNTLSNLMNGNAVGGIGTTAILLLLAVGFMLGFMKIIDLKIPVLAIISYAAVSLQFYEFEQIAINLCSGSFIFVSFFMITDPNTSPNTFLGELIYSIAFGAISALAWKGGYFGENCVFIVALAMDIFVPLMDKFLVMKPHTVGGYRNARKN